MEKYVRIKESFTDCKHHLTKGKLYRILPNSFSDNGGEIMNDRGNIIYLYYSHCSHLGGGSWEIINEECK